MSRFSALNHFGTKHQSITTTSLQLAYGTKSTSITDTYIYVLLHPSEACADAVDASLVTKTLDINVRGILEKAIERGFPRCTLLSMIKLLRSQRQIWVVFPRVSVRYATEAYDSTSRACCAQSPRCRNLKPWLDEAGQANETDTSMVRVCLKPKISGVIVVCGKHLKGISEAYGCWELRVAAQGHSDLF